MKKDKEYKNQIDIQILIRYLEGNRSEEDRRIVEQWFSTHELQDDLYEKSLHFWDGIPADQKIKSYNEDHVLDHIHHKIKIEEAIFLHKTRSGKRFINRLITIAAILFIPVLVASLLLYFQNNSFRNIKSFAEIHSPFGTRTTFWLPDGSTGWLNGGSSLKYPTQFSGKSRNVRLTGEAYFNVVPNHKRPFIVSTDIIDVKVYGTSFNVMAYRDESITEVTLETGQVEIFKNKNNHVTSLGVLQPNESCVYNSQSDSNQIISINTKEKLSWLEGKLTFKYEPFEDVVRKINRWYNVNIVIKDELLDSYIYYGTFKDETLEEVLNLLHFTAPIRYKVIDRVKKQDGTFEKRRIELYYNKKI
jgi:transmembrane sensor